MILKRMQQYRYSFYKVSSLGWEDRVNMNRIIISNSCSKWYAMKLPLYHDA